MPDNPALEAHLLAADATLREASVKAPFRFRDKRHAVGSAAPFQIVASYQCDFLLQTFFEIQKERLVRAQTSEFVFVVADVAVGL